MRLLALFLLVSLTANAEGRFERFCGRTADGRSSRGLQCGGAAFEFAPVSGAGMPAACSTTAPTSATGTALTFTRASNGTCTKTATGGLATTGIADGDLVVLSNNVARVEYDSAGTLGLLVEAAGTNLLLRNIEIDNAAWSDVGTPTLTTGQADPFGATAAVRMEDNDGAAQEGRTQSVTVSAGAAHTMHCYVKAGTLAEASISLDGTAATITGLSASTWSIVTVTDASSSGVSIAASILNGDAVGDTGTIIWGGCDVKTGSYRTSIVPTAGAAATRAVEASTVNGNTLGFPASTYCIAASVQTEWGSAQPAGIVEGQVGSNSGVGFFFVSGFMRAQNLTSGADNTLDFTFTPTALTQYRVGTTNDGTSQTLYRNGVAVAGPTAKTPADSPWSSTTGIGYAPVGPWPLDGIISRIQIDRSPTRCQQ